MNYLRREESRSGTSLELRFTDAAVQALSEPVIEMLAVKDGSQARGSARASASDQRAPNLEQAGGQEEFVQDADFRDVEQLRPDQALPSTVDDPLSRVIERVFTIEGGKTRLSDHRIKATSQNNFVGRLTYLFLEAHRRQGRELVPRDELIQLFRSVEIYDSNALNWLRKCADIEKDDANLRLLNPGIDQALEIAKQIEDSAVQGKWDLNSRGRSTNRKSESSQISGEDGLRRSGASKQRQSPHTLWVENWKEHSPNGIDFYSLLDGKSVSDKAVFALWAIRNTTSSADKSISRRNIARFLREALAFKHDDRGIERALRGSPYVITDKTKFEINPKGVEFIESMISSILSTKGEAGD